jgi:hypothetical protein
VKRRLTITLEDEDYESLLDYAKNEAETNVRPINISRTLEKITQEKLAESNYYPPRARKGASIAWGKMANDSHSRK